MKTIAYVIPEKLPIEQNLLPMMAVDDVISRLDERVSFSNKYRTPSLRDGWMNRLLYREACASRLAAGELFVVFREMQDWIFQTNAGLSSLA